MFDFGFSCLNLDLLDLIYLWILFVRILTINI